MRSCLKERECMCLVSLFGGRTQKGCIGNATSPYWKSFTFANLSENTTKYIEKIFPKIFTSDYSLDKTNCTYDALYQIYVKVHANVFIILTLIVGCKMSHKSRGSK